MTLDRSYWLKVFSLGMQMCFNKYCMVTLNTLFCLLNSVRLADAEDEMRALRRQLKKNQPGDYQEIIELGKK